VEDPGAKERALESFVERMYPGRWKELRPATAQEVKATTVLHMKIEEGAAKIRSGPPVDDDEDYGWPAWAGVVPVRNVSGPPLDDGRLVPGTQLPDYISQLGHLGLRST
jgi:hypothetical protein